MSGDRGQTPNDDQLAQLLQFLARTCLEVERGLRPPDQLTTLMTPRAAQLWRQQRPLGTFPGGPVTAPEIGPPRYSRLTSNRIIATITTATEPGRWGALTLHLEAHQNRWAIIDLQRLLAATHYRSATRPATAAAPVQEQLRRRYDDRNIARAALEAASRRLEGLEANSARHRAAADDVERWQRIVAQLDRGLGARTGAPTLPSTSLPARHR